MKNYFRASEEYPYHISIGGLVFNEEGKILVHHFKQHQLKGYRFEDLYLLMRETIEPNETIEQTLARGLMEEFGMTGELVGYLGSIKGKYPIKDFWAEKTTLYFLVKYIEHEDSKREQGTIEAESSLEWHEPDSLIEKMKLQREVEDSLDESGIVKRFKDWRMESSKMSSER